MRHKHSVTEDPAKVVGIAAIAASIGAAFALLFAPRSGKQTRSGIKRRADHVKEDLHNKFDDNIQEVGDIADDTKSRAKTTAAKVVNDAKTTASKTKSDAATVKRRSTKAAKDTADSAKDAANK